MPSAIATQSVVALHDVSNDAASIVTQMPESPPASLCVLASVVEISPPHAVVVSSISKRRFIVTSPVGSTRSARR